MESLYQYIDESGEKAKKEWHVTISNIEYDSSEASFEIDGRPIFAKIEWHFDQAGGSNEPFVDVTVKELHIVLETSSNKFVPFQIHSHSDFGFSITSIEQQIGASIFKQEKAKAEENHWEDLIDNYESSKY